MLSSHSQWDISRDSCSNIVLDFALRHLNDLYFYCTQRYLKAFQINEWQKLLPATVKQESWQQEAEAEVTE